MASRKPNRTSAPGMSERSSSSSSPCSRSSRSLSSSSLSSFSTLACACSGSAIALHMVDPIAFAASERGSSACPCDRRAARRASCRRMRGCAREAPWPRRTRSAPPPSAPPRWRGTRSGARFRLPAGAAPRGGGSRTRRRCTRCAGRRGTMRTLSHVPFRRWRSGAAGVVRHHPRCGDPVALLEDPLEGALVPVAPT